MPGLRRPARNPNLEPVVHRGGAPFRKPRSPPARFSPTSSQNPEERQSSHAQGLRRLLFRPPFTANRAPRGPPLRSRQPEQARDRGRSADAFNDGTAQESIPYSLSPTHLLDRLRDTQLTLQETVAVIEAWQSERLRIHAPCSPMQDVRPVVSTDYPPPSTLTAEKVLSMLGIESTPGLGGTSTVSPDDPRVHQLRQLTHTWDSNREPDGRPAQYPAGINALANPYSHFLPPPPPPPPSYGSLLALPAQQDNPLSPLYTGPLTVNRAEVQWTSPSCCKFAMPVDSAKRTTSHRKSSSQLAPSLGPARLCSLGPSNPYMYARNGQRTADPRPGTPPPTLGRATALFPTPDTTPEERDVDRHLREEDDEVSIDNDPVQQWTPLTHAEM